SELTLPLISSQLLPPTSSSSLFPYTTLFRSERDPLGRDEGQSARDEEGLRQRLGRLRDDDRGRSNVDGARVAQHRRARDLTTERSEEHTSELQSLRHLVCRLLLEKKKEKKKS